MQSANIALELFGMGVSVLLLLCCIFEKSASKKQTGIFIAMLLVNFFVLLCDMLTWIFENQAERTTMLYALNFFVYTLGYVLTALFTWYLVAYIADRERISKKIVLDITILCAIAVVPVFVSLFNHMYFSFDNGIYVRGSAYWLSQVYPIGIMLADMLIVIRHRRALGLHDTLSLLSYGLLPVIAMAVQIKLYGITLLYIATTASLLIIYVMIHVEQSRRMEKQRAELAQANVAIMLSQIQPHFLYNALGSIRELYKTEPQAADAELVSFSQFLRGNMDSLKTVKPIAFEQELKHTQNYLAIEKIRFEERLNIVYDLKATEFRIPTLTLQPIVENAVRYGVTKRKSGGTVTIATEENRDSYIVTVSDDGVGFNPMQPQEDGKTHIGIQNVRERLNRICGGTLTVTGTPGTGTVAVITIPKEAKKC